MSGAPDSWRRCARASVLSTGGLLSHQAAAANHGLDGFPEGAIEVVIPKDRRIKSNNATVHRSTQLGKADPTEVNGIPTTGLERTVLDVAGVVSYRRLEWLIDAVLRDGQTDWPSLFDVWLRHSIQGRNGCGPVRRLLDERYGDTAIPDSKWNRMVGRLLADAGVGTPAYEHTIRDSEGRFLARVDLAYARQRVAIELDSVKWHLNRESFESDPRRKNKLALAGWIVLTFTWADYADRPGDLLRVVRSALGICGV